MRSGKIFLVLVACALACETFNGEMACQSGDQTDNPADWKDRVFQTPIKGEDGFEKEFESLGRIACFADVTYASGRQSAEVEVSCRQHESVSGLEYSFGGKWGSDSSYSASASSDSKPLEIAIRSDDGEHSITIPEVDFVWQAPEINQSSAYDGGQKGGIVELFGWPYEDIEKECEFLAEAGWMGVKVFPPNE